MRGSRVGLIWLVQMAVGALALVVTGCGVAPVVPTVTPAPVPTPTPIELVIMYTTNTEGIVDIAHTTVIRY
jgi:hypothetical protein